MDVCPDLHRRPQGKVHLMTWNNKAFELLKEWCAGQVRAGNHEFDIKAFRNYFYGEFKSHDVKLPFDSRSWGSLVATARRRGLIYEIETVMPENHKRTKPVIRWGIKL